MSLLETIIVVIAASSVVAGVLPLLVVGLIKAAVRQLPKDIRDRYLEQWLAEAEQLPDGVGKLFWALGLTRASFTIGRDRKPKGASETARRRDLRPQPLAERKLKSGPAPVANTVEIGAVEWNAQVSQLPLGVGAKPDRPRGSVASP